MKFCKEEFSMDLISEMMPLWIRHYAEIADEAYGPLDPDTASYEAVSKCGFLRIFTVRLAGRLKGYQVFFIQRHPHSKALLQATQDLVYLAPEARKGLTGYRFIKWCGDQLAKEGISMVYQHISADHDFGPLLKRMGYRHLDQVYGRNLCQPQSLSR